jgi:hypothetical protein
MLRVGIISKLGNIYSINGTREEIDDYLLDIDNREGLKFYRIIDIDTKEIIETEQGIKNK